MSIRYFPQPIEIPVTGVMQLSVYGDTDKPAILVLGGISATCNPITPEGDGWWQGLSAALPDLTSCCIVSCDYLGGLGQSESTTAQALSIEQQSAAIGAALINAGLADLHAVIGGSYGGQVALGLTNIADLNINKLVLIAAAHRAHAAAVTLRKFQREFIDLATAAGDPVQGVELARALAMFTYRSGNALDHYHPQPEQAYTYLRSRAKQLVTQQPERARSLFENFGPALDRFSFDPAQITNQSLVIGFSTDFLVPPDLLASLAAKLPACVGHHLFDSSYGHDGFIKDTHQYANLVKRFLSDA